MFLLVPAHPGSPGQRAVKRLLLLSLHVVVFEFCICQESIDVRVDESSPCKWLVFSV